MDIALWGYGVFGKRASESLLKYWDEKYTVKKIYDDSQEGIHDVFWDLVVSDPGAVEEDFGRGIYEAVMICISDILLRRRMKEYLQKHDIPVVFPGQISDFISPEEFGTEKVTETEGCSVFSCSNAMAAVADFNRTEAMYVFNEDGKILWSQWRSQNYHDIDLSLMYPFWLKTPVPEVISVAGSCCILAKLYSNNYWHFTFECLNEAFILEQSGFDGTYIINDMPYNREVMQLMGIPPERIMLISEFSVHKVYLFEKLLMVSFPYEDEDAVVYAAVMSKMAGQIRKKLEIRPDYPKRLFVKRTGSRKLENGDQIAEKKGFYTLVPEQHSVREQMEFFYNADIVLCPHGANSTNCLYMRENSVFIEVFSDKWFCNLNWFVCRADHLHHLIVTGTVTDQKQDGKTADYILSEDRSDMVIKKAEEIIEKQISCTESSEKKDRIYHTGLLMGVFDLFHIGHLNLIRRAKQKCCYLRVCVLSDELVNEFKSHYPVIPQNERMEILAALRDVDEVVLLENKDDVYRINEWKKRPFDCFFSGDDYADNEQWKKEKKELNRLGSDMMFFEYTKERSSTMIREGLKERDGYRR